MKKGTIYLYYRDGEMVKGEVYDNVAFRNKVIKKWEKHYAEGYNNTFLQIAPETIDDLDEHIDDNGENKRQPHHYKMNNQ